MDDNNQKRTLAIIGGGGLGRELESWLSKSNLINEYHLVGYLDDNKDSLISYPNDFSVVDEFNPHEFVKGIR
jgi:FlaA1/EpsC-like NDP-sugar epimerase